MSAPLLGAHVSIAGGTPNALERAAERGIHACQIFVKNASQWRAKPLADSEVERFRELREELGIERVVAHGTYLVNLAPTHSATRERSVATLGEEIDRSTALGLDGLVIHPGAHVGAGEETGLERIARNLDRALSKRQKPTPPVLLECTAGQGTVLGYRLEQLARIMELSDFASRLGICLDTCHLFAAGYRIDRRDDLEEVLDRVESLFGFERLVCLHLNDSRNPAGSHRDRHANIGAGEIGTEAFGWLLNDKRLSGIPMILETPLGDDGKGHERDLETLRGLIEE